MSKKIGVLIIAHGSRRKEANEQVTLLGERLRRSLKNSIIEPCFMELAEPSIEDGLRTLHEQGVGEVIIYPYFLFNGIHLTKDVPRIVKDSIENLGVELEWRILDPLGLQAGIFGMVRNSLELELPDTDYEDVAPTDIEKRSMEIIESDLYGTEVDAEAKFVIKRVIHTTGDYDFLQSLRFHPDAIKSGRDAIRNKSAIFTDVTMVQSGINRRHGHEVSCVLNDPEVTKMAKEEGLTRTAAGIRYLGDKLNGAVLAIGNAPTALRTVIEMIEKENIRPALIVGIPVGFVNAAESKTALAAQNTTPYITSLGRKGGSTLAAAIVNAFIKEEFEN